MKSSVGLFLTFLAVGSWAESKAPFEFRDGDRVVLVGDTLIEREQIYGYLEQRLAVQFPERRINFRNLGWSADTPAGESRASFDFDKPGKGFEKLKEELAEVKPTVVIVGYGMGSSLEGRGVTQFQSDLNRLLDAIQLMSSNQPVRVILLGPIRHEYLGPPLPNPKAHNEQLALYVKGLRDIARQRQCEFVSLFELVAGSGLNREPLTDNGIHPSAFGYARVAETVEQGLGWGQNFWSVTIDGRGKLRSSGGTKVFDGSRTGKGVRFTTEDERLVNPALRDALGNRSQTRTPPCQIRVEGLPAGHYELRIDGSRVLVATEKEWGRGVTIERGPQFDQAEALREAILHKNELYFDRWRPQNETYLFGFRKHEQGQNAKEIPMFDPLIAEQEAKIAKLRKPVRHKFEIAPTGSVSGHKDYTGGALRSGAGLSGAARSGAGQSVAKRTAPPAFDVAPGFEVNLWAESPLLAKPIQMNFDAQGRLWIASSSVYPQIVPGQVADDKILVLEDTDGDGYAEKSRVFADGLFIPTGVVPGDGGAYVGQSTELLHFKDTDGDGKADQKRIVLSGFGTEDTHHMVHTLRWGPDGQLYFNQSIYIHSHFETPNGVERLNSGGIWHLRPSTMELGVFLRGFCNPWGHDFDDFGQSFVTDGAGFQGLSYGIPGATYFTYADMRREMKSISAGSYPKFCGLEIVRSEHFPPDWQGNAITCDFRAHRVVRFGIEEQGAGYVARELSDLLRTTNVTFRPIDVKLGPDGALYVADWSNPIIQHGEVDFRDPRRDHEHGRIWRITAKGRPLVQRPVLVTASNQALFEQLLSPNAFNQQQARRVLTERGVKIERDLAKWAKAHRSESARLQALWMYQSMDVVQPSLLEEMLNAKDGRVRAAATRVVSYWRPRLKHPLDLLAARVADEHPRVRLEAMRALAEIPTARSAALVLSVVDKPMDPFLDYGAWLSINELAQPWLAAVKSGEWKPQGRETQLEFALKALEPKLAAIGLAQVMAGKTIPVDGSGPWIELIGTAGNEALLRRLFEQALRGGFDSPATVRALAALSVAARQRTAKPSGGLDGISALLVAKTPEMGSASRGADRAETGPDKIREQALRLIGDWGLKTFAPQVIGIAGNKSEPVFVRQAAFEALREIGGKRIISGLEPLTHSESDAWGRRQAILTLSALNISQASQSAVALLLQTTGDAEAAELWRSLLSIKGAPEALARALPKTNLPPAVAKTGLRAAREGGRSEPELVWALTRGADLEAKEQGLSAAEMQELAASVNKEGDPARGEQIFRRKELSCTTCHAIGGVGGKVGPDLTSIGASAPVDYLIESVLYPNRKIKEGYHSIIVETKDGMDLSGVLASENADQLILRDATGKEISIAKNNIANRATGKSLMPGGLVDNLSPGERLDLFRFLSELGKPGPYDASKGSVARAWKLLPQTLDLAQFGDEKILSTELSDKKWTPAHSLVDGRLPKEELAAALEGAQRRDPPAIYAAAEFQVAKSGAVRLKLEGADGSLAWVDGKPIEFKSEKAPDLATGTHTFVVKLDSKKLPQAIRLESADATFLSQ